MKIRRATVEDLEELVPLFDSYRQFYKFASDLSGARDFLQARLENDESVIFLALQDERSVGFAQLFPSFSSGRMARVYILNDLFVSAEARKSGIGAALIKSARAFGESSGAARLTLSTQIENETAQALYEREGWKRDTEFYVYNQALS